MSFKLWAGLASYSVAFWAFGEYRGWWEKFKLKEGTPEYIAWKENRRRRDAAARDPMLMTGLPSEVLQARNANMYDTMAGVKKTDLELAKKAVELNPDSKVL